jgi:hypothetical protein
MNAASAVSQEAFEARYLQRPDPWRFAESPYELARYLTILSSLGRRAYATVYEPGCSVGVLTRQLATSRSSQIVVLIGRPSWPGFACGNEGR